MPDPFCDTERFPLLDEANRKRLQELYEHPHAPRYTYEVGERLTARGLERVRAYAHRQQSERRGWRLGELPPWLIELVAFCHREVPFHRQRLDWSDDFFSLPSIDREAIRAEPWAFVPDTVDVSELIVYTTTGTTGSRLTLPSHPEAPSRYLPLIQTALASRGITLEGGRRVSIVHVSAQRSTFTFASLISYLDFAGFVRVNLHPSQWRHADDPLRFLESCAPEIYTGDPFALTELARLPLQARPRALVSSAAALLPGLRQRLESHFGCPVLDVYSLNEAGPVAFEQDGQHEILPHNLYVEILDDDDQPCPPGVLGEITLSGGANPYLPLLRYRTGDFAALSYTHPIPRLIGLQGRAPVILRTASGRLFNNIDVTMTLQDLALPLFALHQHADGSLMFRTRCDGEAAQTIEQRLAGLFEGLPLTIEQITDATACTGKLIQYSTDLEQESL